MVLMSAITAPIRSAMLARACTVASVRRVSSTAAPAIFAEWETWLAISRVEIDSSSVAAATVCTFIDACSAAAATLWDCRLVCSAVAAMVWAVVSISRAAVVSVWVRAATFASNWRVSSSRRWARRACASASPA